MWRKINSPFVLAFAVAVVCPDMLIASQVSFKGLDADAESIAVVVLGSVTAVRQWEENRITSADGRYEPISYVEYEVRVKRMVLGKGFKPGQSVRFEHTVPIPVEYDAQGNEVLHWSPRWSGTLLNHQLQQGHTYLLSLEQVRSGRESQLLFRADEPDRERELLGAIERVRNTRKANQPVQPTRPKGPRG